MEQRNKSIAELSIPTQVMVSCYEQGEKLPDDIPASVGLSRTEDGKGILVFQSAHYRVGYVLSVGVRQSITGHYIIGDVEGHELFSSFVSFIEEFGLDINKFRYVSASLLNSEMLKFVMTHADKESRLKDDKQ